jgi:hypothetical protein
MVRVYFDESGNVVAVEHRPNEDYSDENATREKTAWISVDSQTIEGQSWEDYVVKRKKLVKRK